MKTPNAIDTSEARYQPFPLTDIQQSYYVGRSSDFIVGNVGSHTYLEYEMEDLDIDRLRAAWREVVERHDSLRTVFTSDVQQKTLQDVSVPEVACTDLRDASESEVSAHLEECRRRMGGIVFDPLVWPLFQMEVSLLPGRRVRIHLAIDMLIADAWSSGIVKRSLLAAYARPGALQTTGANAVAFRDYVVALGSRKATRAHRESIAYWNDRIEGLPAPPELPTRVPRQAGWKPRFRRTLTRLSGERWGLIKSRSVENGVTATTVLITAFALVLSRFCENKHFLLNIPFNGRLLAGERFLDTVGDFTSIILLEMDFREQKSFGAYCKATQKRLVQDLEHVSGGGVGLIREISKRRGIQFIAPVVFTSTVGMDDSTQSPLDAEQTFKAGQTPQVVLDHIMSEEGDALQFGWNAVEEVFPEGYLRDMWGCYQALLDELTASPDKWGEHLRVEVPDWQRELRREVNNSARAFDVMRLDEMFVRQAQQTPDARAIIQPPFEITYAQLLRKVESLCGTLLDAGVVPGDTVAVIMDKGWEQVAAVFAILRAGAAYVPLDPDLPPLRLQAFLSHAQARVALTQPPLLEPLQSLPVPLIVVTPDFPGEQEISSRKALPARDVDEVAYVIYTSGSTGAPKGVVVTHRAVFHTLMDLNLRFSVSGTDRVFALTSLSFDLSVYDVFGFLGAGAALVMPTKAQQKEPLCWPELVARLGVTVWNSVPVLFKMYVEECAAHAPTCDSLRLVMISGDKVPPQLVPMSQTLNDHVKFAALGGATEAAIWSVCLMVEKAGEDWACVPYGRPLANQTVQILDSHLNECPMWVPGELYIGGAGLAEGYLRESELTKKAFITHPLTGERLYRAGDRGRYLPDGHIEFLGRVDHQVKVHGFRIETGEIEAALLRQAGVSEAAVVPFEEDGDRRLAAFVTITATFLVEPAVLRQRLKTVLPWYMVPALVVVLKELPKTRNGKIDRAILQSMGVQSGASDRYVAPVTPLERQLSRVFEETLGLENVGSTDSFFDLGGDSILATKLVQKIREQTSVQMSTQEMFEYPTVSALASEVTRRREQPPRDELPEPRCVDERTSIGAT